MKRTVVFLDTGLSAVTGGVYRSRIGREEPGAQLVAACCQRVGWNVRYLRPDSDNPAYIYQVIKEGPCDVLVLFPYTYTKWLADAVAKMFKGKAIIVYGGYHCIGVSASQVLDEGVADYVIAGRGEESLSRLLQQLASGNAPMLPQVLHHPSGALENKDYPLDRLPWPIRQKGLMQDLTLEPLPFRPPSDLEASPRKCVIISGAIGCHGRCDFCPSWIISSKPLHRSPKDIVEEMVWLRDKYGPGLVFHFSNPLFNANRDWIMELCAEMERHGPFPSICMPDFCLDWEMVQAMKRAGIYFAMMGLEFSSTQLRIARGKRAGDPATAYALCAEAGIITRAFFMLARLGMTLDDLIAEIVALEEFPFRADELRPNFEIPPPGTQVNRRIMEWDLVAPQSHWTTEEVVCRTGLSSPEWQKQRWELVCRYHFSERQQAHYRRQIERFPVLKGVYWDFLRRLAAGLVCSHRGA